MCNLTKEIDHPVIGYKVAAKRGGRYYSIATGIKYGGKVKVRRKPKQIGDFFVDVLASPFFKKEMVGRTAAFLVKSYAVSLRRQIVEHIYMHNVLYRIGYEIVVLKVLLSDSVMTGCYGDGKVAAGKYMEIIEEIKFKRSYYV